VNSSLFVAFDFNFSDMKKDAIVQFVGYITTLPAEAFIELWKPFAKQLAQQAGDIMLQEAVEIKGRCKFNFVSRHEGSTAGLRAVFMKSKDHEQFPEHKVKMMQAGGYTFHPSPRDSQKNKSGQQMQVIAFLDHRETNLDFYKGQLASLPDIFEAFYENCTYGNIVEYFIPEENAPALLEQLKTRIGSEAGLYKECMLVH
jgi:hypothetical protein